VVNRATGMVSRAAAGGKAGDDRQGCRLSSRRLDPVGERRVLEVVRSGLVGLVFTLPMMAAADTLTYAVTDESWVPYWMVDDGQVSGVLSDVMHALDERLVVDLQAARPAPPLRAQKMFRDGQVQLMCCVSQQWRTAPEQVEVTLWTEPVLEAH